jgi:ribosomal RNA-processing protein 9
LKQPCSEGLTEELKIYRYGHEDGITAIDSMKHEQAVSCGGRDTTVRLWKVVTESQLVFNGSG